MGKISIDPGQVAALAGRIDGGAKVIAQMTDKKLGAATVGDDDLAHAITAFSQSWNFRRKYFIKDMKMLGAAADNFITQVTKADKDASDFVKTVKANYSKAMGAKK